MDISIIHEIESKLTYFVRDMEDHIEEVKDLIERQPYKVYCSECNGELEYKKELDSSGDLTLDISPCKSCNKGNK